MTRLALLANAIVLGLIVGTVRGEEEQGPSDAAKAREALERSVDTAIKSAAAVRTGDAAFPLLDPAAPVTLEVLYDDKPTPIIITGGAARIALPEPGQKVSLVVRRLVKDKSRLGIVLRVNGESTLFRERQRDFVARKWILDPHMDRFVVKGYAFGPDKLEELRLEPQPAPKRGDRDFAEHVGTISLTVFAEEQVAAPPIPLELGDDFAEDLAAVSWGVLPESAKSLAALKHQLREGPYGPFGRQRIAPFNIPPVRTITFKADPMPRMSATIRYGE